MNYIERYFKRKEKVLKKNQSQLNLEKNNFLKKEQKKDTNENSLIETNKESYIHPNVKMKKNSDSNNEFEIFKQQQYETKVNKLKQKRFFTVYSKEKFEKVQLKEEDKDKNNDQIYERKADIKYKNMNMYIYIISKKNITKTRYILINIDKDGNCFYKCVSFFLYGTMAYHREVRNTISNVCKANIEVLSDFQAEVEIRKDKYIPTRDYIYMISDEGNWATNIDISVTAYIYNINIAIYFNDEKDEELRYAHIFSYEDNDYKNPLLLLQNENFNHFNIFYDCDEYDDSNDNSTNNKEFLIDSNKNENSEYKSQKNKEISTDKKIKTSINDDNKCEEKKKESVKSVVKYKYESNNPYPKYILGEDENLYLNIYNFLKNGLIKNKRSWPNYIEEIKDKRKKDQKKVDFCRKIGIYKRKDIRCKTSKHENSKEEYRVENDELYFIRKEIKNKYKEENNEEIKVEYIEKKYKIPKASQIKNLLVKHHDNHLHQGRDGTYFSILEDKYYWIGIKKDIEIYIKNCVDCAKMKTIEKSKREKTVTILSHGPRDRYVADLWYLPEYLKGHSNYLYVLDIIDHFSKYCNSYLLNTKEKYEVFTHIREFIEKNGKPNYLVTDNGTEFKNKLLAEYCQDNKIKFLHGLPYRPHSQGVVERLHRIIKKGLSSYKLKLKKTYNIDYAIAEIVRIKNNTYCRTTKETPNNLFFKEFNEEEIKKINSNILESQKYSNIYKNTFNLKEKILLNDNFIIDNRTLKKKIKSLGYGLLQ